MRTDGGDRVEPCAFSACCSSVASFWAIRRGQMLSWRAGGGGVWADTTANAAKFRVRGV